MINYSYSNDLNKSIIEKEAAKQSWIEKLGKFSEEFDKMNGFVDIRFPDIEEDGLYFSFNIGDDAYRIDFIERFNYWVREGRPE